MKDLKIVNKVKILMLRDLLQNIVLVFIQFIFINGDEDWLIDMYCRQLNLANLKISLYI
jgi:hypothetical protein